MEKIPVYEGREPYIFISYAHKDSKTVLPVVESLYRDKYRVWYDEGIAPGSEWPHYIAVHLENCDTVAVFMSENSAASINCENEIVRALELGKNIIVCDIDGTEQERLGDCPNADVSGGAGELEKLLDDRLIGDGVTGYERILRKGSPFMVGEWDMLIFMLVIIIILAAFGTSNGFFDDYLPGRDNSATEAEESTEEEVIENDLLAEAILSQVGKDDLMKAVEFENAEAGYSFASAIGTGRKITAFDLAKDHRETLVLDYADDETIALLKYFPDLTEVEIRSGEFTSLKELDGCRKLETVALSRDIFPVEIPDDAKYDVTLIQ